MEKKIKRYFCTFIVLIMMLQVTAELNILAKALWTSDKVAVIDSQPENDVDNNDLDLFDDKSIEQVKGNDISIDIDFSQFSFNEKTKNYDSKAAVKSITGTLSTNSATESFLSEIKSFKYIITSLDGVFEGDIDVSEQWEIKNLPLVSGINGIRFELIANDDAVSAKAMTVNYQHKIEKRGLKSAETQPKYDPQVYAALMAPKPAAAESPQYTAYELQEDIVYDEIIEGDVVLDARLTLANKKVLYKGNVILKAGATINVNSVFAVEGNLILSGSATFQGITYVGGDFRIQNIDAEGEFGLTNVLLTIVTGAKVVVKGDFYNQSSQAHSSNIDNGNNGILELHGDMHLLSAAYKSSWNYGFTTVFAGAKEQHVYATSTNAHFGKIMTAKTGGFVNFDDTVGYVSLVGNAIVKNGRFKLIHTQGFTLTATESLYIESGNISGQVYTGKDLNLYNTGELRSLTFQSGSYTEVGGDFRIQNIDAEGAFGLTTAIMYIYTGAKVVVKGNFYNQSSNGHGNNGADAYNGILELHGNMHLLSAAYKYDWTRGFTTVFAGAKEQHVYATSTDVRFGNMMTAKTGGFVNFDDPVRYVSLVGNATVKNGRFKSIQTQGFTLTAEESLYIENGYISGQVYTGKDLVLYGASVTQFVLGSYTEVSGDLRIQNMDAEGAFGLTTAIMYIYTGAKVVVKGDFYNQSSNGHGNNGADAYNGILELHGNMHLLSAAYKYHRNNGFTTVFAGANEQHVYASSTDVRFGKISQRSKDASIVLHGVINQISAQSDLNFKGSGKILSGSMNGNSVRFREHANITSLTLGGGILIADESLTVDGSLNLGGGIVKTGGNFRLKDTGNISMSNDYDKLLVGGTFYNDSNYSITISKGILDIKGHFIKSTTSPFTSGSTALVQLTGGAHQRVEFPLDSYGRSPVSFYNLGVNKNPNTGYTFSKVPCWTNLMWSVDTSEISKMALKRHFGYAGVHGPTGNYSQSFTDMTTPSIIGEMAISRSYNSMDNEASMVGNGFTFSHSMKILTEKNPVTDKDIKTVILPNGAAANFEEKSDGKFEAMDSRGTLTKVGGEYIMQTMDQSKYVFNSSGHIKYIEDKLGNTLFIDVNSDGNITAIYDTPRIANIEITYSLGKITKINNKATGRSVTYSYSGDQLTQVVDATGKKFTYEYHTVDKKLLKSIKNNAGVVVESMEYYAPTQMGTEQVSKVKSVTDIAGNKFTYTYDEEYMKTTITDSNGRSEIQHYDTSRNVTAVTDPLGQVSRTQYSLVNGVNKFGEMLSETDHLGNITRYTYDAKGNVTRVTYPDGGFKSSVYDKWNNVTSATDVRGSTTTFVYDADGKFLLKTAKNITGGGVYSESANQDNFAITSYTYDTAHAMKGLVKTETPPMGDANNRMENTHNSKGQVTNKSIYINGTKHTTVIEYDALNRPVKETAPDGVVSEFVYNIHDEITRSSVTHNGVSSANTYTYDALGRKTNEKSPLQVVNGGIGTKYEYDNAGNVLKQSDSLGNFTTYTYDFYGNVLTEKLPNGSISTYTYDKLNRKTSGKFYDGITGKTMKMEETSYVSVGTNMRTISTIYLDSSRATTATELSDYAGRILETTNTEGNTARATYNKAGDVLTSTDLYGKITRNTYDTNGNILTVTAPFEGTATAVSTSTYDKMGKKLTETMNTQKVGGGVTTRKVAYEYDKWSNLVKTIQYDGDKAASYVQAYYDFRGRAVRQYKNLSSPLTITGLDQVTPNGDNDYAVIKNEYNYLDKVIKTTDPLGQSETMQYDVSGNLTGSTDRMGGKYVSTYDILGRKLTESKSLSGKASISKSFTYNGMGEMTKLVENGATTSFTFNGQGHKLSETNGSIVSSYSYDYMGTLLTAVVKDGGEVLSDARNTYDNMGRLVTVSSGSTLSATYTYDRGSRLITTKHANGITETNTYNDAGLITKLINKDAANKIISEYSYTYSVDGNQITKTENSGNVVTNYEYDALNRLVKEVRVANEASGVVETTDIYRYDDNGNRIQKLSHGPSGPKSYEYEYDLNDQILREETQFGTFTYTYDANGNMLSKTKNGGTETITQVFDAMNRLVKFTEVKNGKTVTATYTYNHANRRDSKVVTENGKTTTTNHIWDGDEIVVDIIDGNMINYVHGIKLISSKHTNCDCGSCGKAGTSVENIYVFLSNAHGDVVALVLAGTIVARYDYDAYGMPKHADLVDESDSNPFRYSGEYLDFESGYIYLRARYYSPELGRFINQDPIRDGQNWHAYGNNNPIMFSDPTGHFCFAVGYICYCYCGGGHSSGGTHSL